MSGKTAKPNGSSTSPDDETISDDDIVIRKIPRANIHPVPGTDRYRVSKSAFSASSSQHDEERGMSVDLLSTLTEIGIDPTSRAYAPEFSTLMTLKVGSLRHDLGLSVVRRPRGDNEAHCNVLGVVSSKRKKLLNIADWLRRPPNIAKS